MIQKYTQTTCESCFTVSLLQAVDRVKPFKITKKLEVETLMAGILEKDDFVGGQINQVIKKFKRHNLKVTRIINNIKYHGFLKKMSVNKTTNLIVDKVTPELITKYLADGPIIVNIDSFMLGGGIHYPHYITVLKKEKNDFEIFDPWYGETKKMTRTELRKAISSLNNRLWICPMIITVQ